MFPNRATQQKWSKEEEMALVSAYVVVSEDPIIGNAQTNGMFIIIIIIVMFIIIIIIIIIVIMFIMMFIIIYM